MCVSFNLLLTSFIGEVSPIQSPGSVGDGDIKVTKKQMDVINSELVSAKVYQHHHRNNYNIYGDSCSLKHINSRFKEIGRKISQNQVTLHRRLM